MRRTDRRRLCFLIAGLSVILVTGRCSPTTGRPPGANSKETAAAVLVDVSRPMRETVVRRLEVVATLEPWEEAVLYAKASGYLRSIRVDRGDRARKGDLLALLDIPEMGDEHEQLQAQERQADADVQRAQAEVRLQELTVHRLQAIRAEEPGATTEQEVDLAAGRLEMARASLAAAEARLAVVRADLRRIKTLLGYARITAPFDGTITERFVDPGALVTAGTGSKPTPIVTIVNPTRLRAMVDVPDTEVAHVAKGKAARVRVDAHRDKVFAGAVSRFSRALDPKSRTMRTEILIANPDGVLAPGMFGSISLDLERRENVLTLPPAALRFQMDQVYVFVAENGRARRVDVVCGVDDGNTIEIVSGLTGVESIITKASGPLGAGSAITIAGSPVATGGR